MELLELSEKKLKEENKKLYGLIVKDYNYDLVVFIARGSYLIGRDLADLNDAALIELFATRNGGKFKKFISPILKVIPKGLKTLLRKKEFNSNFHEKNNDRMISFNEKQWEKHKDSKKILLVDDSVDTGYSVKYAKNAIENYFKNSEVKVAALNYFNKSTSVVRTDYYLYNEKLLLGPWSNDSKENKDYLDKYIKWHERYVNDNE